LQLGTGTNIPDASAVYFTGGNLNDGGVTETMGALFLSNSATITMQNSTHSLTFASAGTFFAANAFEEDSTEIGVPPDSSILDSTSNIEEGDPSMFESTPTAVQPSSSMFGATPSMAEQPTSMFGATPSMVEQPTSVFASTPPENDYQSTSSNPVSALKNADEQRTSIVINENEHLQRREPDVFASPATPNASVQPSPAQPSVVRNQGLIGRLMTPKPTLPTTCEDTYPTFYHTINKNPTLLGYLKSNNIPELVKYLGFKNTNGVPTIEIDGADVKISEIIPLCDVVKNNNDPVVNRIRIVLTKLLQSSRSTPNPTAPSPNPTLPTPAPAPVPPPNPTLPTPAPSPPPNPTLPTPAPAPVPPSNPTLPTPTPAPKTTGLFGFFGSKSAAAPAPAPVPAPASDEGKTQPTTNNQMFSALFGRQGPPPAAPVAPIDPNADLGTTPDGTPAPPITAANEFPHPPLEFALPSSVSVAPDLGTTPDGTPAPPITATNEFPRPPPEFALPSSVSVAPDLGTTPDGTPAPPITAANEFPRPPLEFALPSSVPVAPVSPDVLPATPASIFPPEIATGQTTASIVGQQSGTPDAAPDSLPPPPPDSPPATPRSKRTIHIISSSCIKLQDGAEVCETHDPNIRVGRKLGTEKFKKLNPNHIYWKEYDDAKAAKTQVNTPTPVEPPPLQEQSIEDNMNLTIIPEGREQLSNEMFLFKTSDPNKFVVGTEKRPILGMSAATTVISPNTPEWNILVLDDAVYKRNHSPDSQLALADLQNSKNPSTLTETQTGPMNSVYPTGSGRTVSYRRGTYRKLRKAKSLKKSRFSKTLKK
jgi:hypothetical protein